MIKVPNTYYRTSTKGLIFDDQGRFLLAKEESGKWDLPGGGMDWGETPQECLMREIREEMGLATTWIADHPSYFYPAQLEDGRWFAFVIYEARLEHLEFTPSDECIEIGFFTLEEAKNQNIFGNLRILFDQYDPKRHSISQVSGTI